MLTNGQCWRAYCVANEKPIEQDLVFEFDFLALNRRSEDDIALLYLLCKEGWAKSAIKLYQEQRQAISRFIVGAAILSDEGLAAIRKAVQRTVADGKHKDEDIIRVSIDDVRGVIENEVIKREVLEDPRAEPARRKVAKASKNPLKDSSGS